MANFKKIIECVPNFSEGRDPDKINKIVQAFQGKEGVKLLDYQSDKDHNRMVVTVIGSPEAIEDALIEAVCVAIELIDMTKHAGQHPRMGAVDVVPFIPIRNITMDEAVSFSKKIAEKISKKFDLPVFLYEKSALISKRINLAQIRKGEFEGIPEKMKQEQWKPDFGPDAIHPTAGVTAVGARMPLVAFNVNLHTNDFQIADKIAKKVRYISGGLRYCKAMAVVLKDRNMVQVSMNLTDYTRTAIYRVFELIRIEAKQYGITIAGSEVVGLLPMEAFVDTAIHYLRIEDFSMDQILESRLME